MRIKIKYTPVLILGLFASLIMSQNEIILGEVMFLEDTLFLKEGAFFAGKIVLETPRVVVINSNKKEHRVKRHLVRKINYSAMDKKKRVKLVKLVFTQIKHQGVNRYYVRALIDRSIGSHQFNQRVISRIPQQSFHQGLQFCSILETSQPPP